MAKHKAKSGLKLTQFQRDISSPYPPENALNGPIFKPEDRL